MHHFFKTKHHSRLHDKHFGAKKEILIEHAVNHEGSLQGGSYGYDGGAVAAAAAATAAAAADHHATSSGSAGVGFNGGAGSAGSAGIGGAGGATYSSTSTFQFNKHGPGLIDNIFAVSAYFHFHVLIIYLNIKMYYRFPSQLCRL